MAEQFQERQVAVKLRIKEIKEGDYVTEEGWKPNYLLTKRGIKVSRANLMGVVLDKEENGSMVNLVLDDGSGKIMVRSFEEIKGLKSIGVGESVLVVGKLRAYNEEKYVAPEIIKKVNKTWLKVRGLELEENCLSGDPEVPAEEESPVEEEEFMVAKNTEIIEVIKELDKGEGALIEEVVEKIEKGEEMVEKMLEKGEIFQNLPGRVKVL